MKVFFFFNSEFVQGKAGEYFSYVCGGCYMYDADLLTGLPGYGALAWHLPREVSNYCL